MAESIAKGREKCNYGAEKFQLGDGRMGRPAAADKKMKKIF
jgi:hypothetical protein